MEVTLLQNSWDRIVAWCLQHDAELLEGLNPGATEEMLQEAEGFLGLTFPEEMRTLYRLHNGKDKYSAYLLPGVEWLSLEELCMEWDAWDSMDMGRVAQASSQVRADFWNIRWIPLTSDGNGKTYCVDLAPAEEGTSGQVICLWHHTTAREYIAPSLAQWLQQIAEGLETGRLVSQGYGIFEAEE